MSAKKNFNKFFILEHVLVHAHDDVPDIDHAVVVIIAGKFPRFIISESTKIFFSLSFVDHDLDHVQHHGKISFVFLISFDYQSILDRNEILVMKMENVNIDKTETK